MKRISTAELKNMTLDILSDVSNFCEKNHLRYYLYYGTLLGAIRHNGYIPWDDDVDIMMPRPDYEEFIKTFNKTDSQFKVIEDRLTKGYNLTYAKVHNPKTVVKSEVTDEMSYGIFVDVFPFDGIKNQRQGNSVFVLTKLLNAKVDRWWSKRGLLHNLLVYLFKLLTFPVSKRWFLNKIRNVSSKITYDDSDMVNFVKGGMKTCVPRRSIEGKVTYHTFENRTYRIPCDYDTCLKQCYGDYMQFPPKEEQVGHPQIAYWIE